MKTFLFVVLSVLAVFFVSFLFAGNGTKTSNADECKAPSDPKLSVRGETRSNSSDGKKPGEVLSNRKTGPVWSLGELERLGSVPDGADERTWRLCEQTSWWGKPLDPDAFWSNRVVWLSWDAENEANRHGRQYPPIPKGNSMFLDRSDSDVSDPLATWEFRGRAYVSSNRERVYWNWRELHCPWPPEKIQFGLERASSEWKAVQNQPVPQPVGLRIPPSSENGRFSGVASRFSDLGFPKEALSKEVLVWEYVRCKRQERETIAREPEAFRKEMLLDLFNRDLACDPSLVEAAPTDEEIRVTKGWRLDYLRRLRHEGTDESYIQAYKKAWSLSEDDLTEKTDAAAGM